MKLKYFWLVPALLSQASFLAAADDRTFSVTTGYFWRNRTDDNIKDPAWPSQLMKSNTINTVFDISSGYLGGWLKGDLSWIGAVNFQKDYRCSEVAFCSNKNDIDGGRTNIWAHNDQDGIALNRATLGVQQQYGDLKLKVKAGYDQLNAGVLGNNWGFLFPGSWRGSQLDAELGALTFNYAWADAYRTPWATEYGHFFDPTGKHIKEIQTAGIKYKLENGLYAEAAAGQSLNWQKRHFGKLGWNGKLGDSDFYANYQHYKMHVTGVDGLGRENSHGEQNVLSTGVGVSGWNFTFEYVGTQVDTWFAVPEFIPRLTYGYGNGQGRLDYWFNAVSDFNKDGERALNLGIKPQPLKFDNLTVSTGVNLISANHISGFDKTTHAKTDSSGYERGYNLDLGFGFAEGALKSLSTSFHYTHLQSGGKDIDPDDPKSLYFRYGLYTTNDLKIMVIYSYAFAG